MRKHLLFECYMYASLRDKLITRLNNIPAINTDTSPNIPLIINNDSLRQNLMHILSPYTTKNLGNDETSQYNSHHKIPYNTPEKEHRKQRQSCIVNCICSYICNVLKLRRKYTKSMQENRIIPSVITIKGGSGLSISKT